MDLTEDRLRKTVADGQKQTEEQENKVAEMIQHISTIIDERFILIIHANPYHKSSDIRESSLISFNEEADAALKTEAMNKMKLLLTQLQKMKFDSELTALSDLKNHFLMLHQTLYDTLKKLGNTNNEIVTLEVRPFYLFRWTILEKVEEKV